MHVLPSAGDVCFEWLLLLTHAYGIMALLIAAVWVCRLRGQGKKKLDRFYRAN